VEVNDLIEIEDLKWRQRAKQAWLQQEDKNSKYFHACVNQRRKVNEIKKKNQNLEGELCTEPVDIKGAFLQYYKGLFRDNNIEGIDACLSGMECRVTQQINTRLLRHCIVEKVSQALQFIGRFKAPIRMVS
jgi:hypothetical protein